jgi:predicted RNA binding protein YcfA (HicA-like mRNA interferase family)
MSGQSSGSLKALSTTDRTQEKGTHPPTPLSPIKDHPRGGPCPVPLGLHATRGTGAVIGVLDTSSRPGGDASQSPLQRRLAAEASRGKRRAAELRKRAHFVQASQWSCEVCPAQAAKKRRRTAPAVSVRGWPSVDNNLTLAYAAGMTWGELIRLLKRHGWREERAGRGSHLLLSHPTRRAMIWVSQHTKHEVGSGLVRQILKDAGIDR